MEILRISARHTGALMPTNPGQLSPDFYQRFLNHLQVKAPTYKAYSVAIRNFMAWLEVNGIRAPKCEDMGNWVRHLSQVERKEPTTVRLYVAAVKVFFDYLCNDLQAYPNIAARTKAPKPPKGHRKGFLTAEQVRAVLESIDTTTAKGKRDRAIIALMVSCGLRDVEVYRANIENLTTRGAVDVLEVWGKGRDVADALVVVPGPAMEALRDYLKTRMEVPSDSLGSPLFVSMSRNGTAGRMTTRTVSRICKTALRAAGIDRRSITAHSLRHTFATLSYLSGESIEDIKQACRHSSVTTTQTYVHEIEEYKNTCSAAVSSAIFGT